MFHPHHVPPTWAGEVNITSANRCSSRTGKIKGRQREREELNHGVWSGIAAGFHTFLLLSLPGSCALCLIPIIRVDISDVYP